LVSNQPDEVVKCQRCGHEVDRERTPSVSTRRKTMYFCDNCFKAVFKYDETLRTIPMLWEENGRKLPFVVRSTNWHKSSFMLVKEVREEEAAARAGKEMKKMMMMKKKQVFIGDMYLRGVLKEQNRPLGKATFFNWVSWSEELASKYKEEPPSQESTGSGGATTATKEGEAAAAAAEAAVAPMTTYLAPGPAEKVGVIRNAEGRNELTGDASPATTTNNSTTAAPRPPSAEEAEETSELDSVL
jgi:hypothetical protein